MKRINEFMRVRQRLACACLGAVVLVFASGAFAKTPDGMPPSQETVCSGLSGAAFGLCNAYCEAQDCDVHARPSCPVLRRNFEKITGSPFFPCDQACGNGRIDRGEECDPPGSLCTTGVPCTATCSCGTEPTGCCECPAGTVSMCRDGVTESACLANGCLFAPPGTTCNPALGGCVPPGNCCQCEDDLCFDVPSPDLCPAGCVPVPGPSMCDASGNCQSVPVP